MTERHTFARWDGEEFIIMCEQTNKSSAHKLCKQINHLLGQFDIQPVKQITCSFGIAESNKNEDILKCIERVDHAMYQANSNGRNQIICA